MRPTVTRRVGLPMIKDDPAGVINCTCGWLKVHTRKKVREDAAEAHLTKKHNGIGAWL
jgi:hypothetical protein